MKSPDIDSIQRYIAYVSVGASTVRGLRTKGVVAAARDALRKVDLSRYAETDKNTFGKILDLDTNRVKRKLPENAQHWGVARKVLNIFLRGCLYNVYLNKHYKLSKLESYFEIPLDSLTANGIRDATTAKPKPRWPGVKHVNAEINKTFQKLASEIANEKDTYPVHLDAIFWGGR